MFAQEQPTLASRRLAWLSSGLWVGSAAAGVALANGGQACRVFHRKPSLLPPGVLGTLPFHPGSRRGGARELRWALITSDNTRSCRQTTWGLGNCLLNASFSGALQNAHSEHDKLADALDSGRRKGTAHAAGRSAWLALENVTVSKVSQQSCTGETKRQVGGRNGKAVLGIILRALCVSAHLTCTTAPQGGRYSHHPPTVRNLGQVNTTPKVTNSQVMPLGIEH